MKKKKSYILIFVFSILFPLAKAWASFNDSLPKNSGLPDTPGGIRGVLENILRWLLGVVGVVAIGSFVISGIKYFMVVGDEKELESAKKSLKYSIFGIVVAISGFIVIKTIDAIFNSQSVF